MEYSADCSGMRSSRLSSRCACSSTSGGMPGILDRLLEFRELGFGAVGFAEFLLNLMQPLAQHGFLLPVVEGLAGPLIDLARHLQHLDAPAEQRQARDRAAP